MSESNNREHFIFQIQLWLPEFHIKTTVLTCIYATKTWKILLFFIVRGERIFLISLIKFSHYANQFNIYCGINFIDNISTADCQQFIFNSAFCLYTSNFASPLLQIDNSFHWIGIRWWIWNYNGCMQSMKIIRFVHDCIRQWTNTYV